MTAPLTFSFAEAAVEAIDALEGRVVVLADEKGGLDTGARRLNRVAKGALKRAVESRAFADLKAGEAMVIPTPADRGPVAIQLVKLPRRASPDEARKAGSAIAGFRGPEPMTIIATGARRGLEALVEALALKSYDFDAYRTKKPDSPEQSDAVALLVADPAAAEAALAPVLAVADGVRFARDLIWEPANVLSTTEFATRLQALEPLGLTVEVLEETDLERLGMRAMLGVGQGSASPSKLVVIEWKGAEAEAPLAVIGKGVVFDTGGISIKPAQGMEEMTMDMGGAGVVAGLMKALALRKAPAHVVGLVGLVENMPDGRAQRPGDVVRSMKGDTIEVINTDAEGRLVLADVMWYAQDRFKPAAMVDLATLTGAIIVALGHENAGVFANDDALADAFLKAARETGEGAWRMPLGEGYDKLLKSRIADIANVSGGRAAGSVTAAQFLQRFVKDGTPWLHLDIAGVAYVPKETVFSPKGVTGWGVRALDRLIRDRFGG